MKGPFKVKVSKEAIKLDISTLSIDEKRVLVEKCNFDPQKHEIYKFSIIPVFPLFVDERIPRKMKKIAYEKVDKVLIHTTCDPENLKFYSAFPTTCTAEGQWSIDFSIEGKVNLLNTDNAKLTIAGLFKSKIRKDVFSIYSSCCEDLAQWIFLEKWIKKVADYNIEVTAVVLTELVESKRYIKCDGQFKSGNRSLAHFKNKKIFFKK
ncbi:MAG: hypothetical protein WCK78_13210 [Paludibacter sp.]